MVNSTKKFLSYLVMHVDCCPYCTVTFTRILFTGLGQGGTPGGTRVGRQKGVRMGRKEDVSMCGGHSVEGNIGGQLCCNLLVTSLQDLTMVGYQEKGRMGRGERKA